MARALPASFRPQGTRPLWLLLDLDGTLAPIRRDPDAVRLSALTLATLVRLRNRGVHLVVVSGRPASFLSRVLPRWLPFVSEHGARKLTFRMRRKMARVRADLAALCKAWPGARLEVKSSALAVHYRNVPARLQTAFVATLRAGFLDRGVRVLEGRRVFELLFAGGSKHSAVQKFLRRHPEAFFVAFGDDVTDERVFDAVNQSGGVSIRVGNRQLPTCARFFVPNVGSVHALLRRWSSSGR